MTHMSFVHCPFPNLNGSTTHWLNTHRHWFERCRHKVHGVECGEGHCVMAAVLIGLPTLSNMVVGCLCLSTGIDNNPRPERRAHCPVTKFPRKEQLTAMTFVYRSAVGQESVSHLAKWLWPRVPHETVVKLSVKAVVTRRIGGTGGKGCKFRKPRVLRGLDTWYTERGWRYRTWV